MAPQWPKSRGLMCSGLSGSRSSGCQADDPADREVVRARRTTSIVRRPPAESGLMA